MLSSGSAPEPQAILFENVGVRYRVPHEQVSGLKEYTIRWLQRRLVYNQFWALRNVNFEVKRGEVFGVIGRNGAGKSTMLKAMARVLQPTEGRIVMRGRLAPLLELGGGFHPELTGRENVYLNMALLGHPRQQTDQLFEGIVAFAEIDEFIDAPLRTYSTGMVARLGFAVATCLRPDVLLVDEVLSVGDARFQEKCLERMISFVDQGTTVVIVSHSMTTIETFCDRVLWLERGRVKAIGQALDVASLYLDNLEAPVVTQDEAQPESLGNLPGSLPVISVPGTPGEGHSQLQGVDGIEHRQQSAISEAASLATPGKGYACLAEVGGIYPTSGIFDATQGSVSVWLRDASSGVPPRSGQVSARQYPAAIFHTDDSRYVLYVGAQYIHSQGGVVRKIVGRAGGNRRALDRQLHASIFPEVEAVLDAPIEPEGSYAVLYRPGSARLSDVWRLVVMTWQGYPEGSTRLYIDGVLAGEKTYTRRNDAGNNLPTSISVGMRPSFWAGEILRNEDGSLTDLRPGSTMSIQEASIEIKDLRLYNRALSPDEIQALGVTP